jgi:hypothetical protein
VGKGRRRAQGGTLATRWHLEGKHFTREDQVIAAVREVFDKTPLQTFQDVMDDWQYRLKMCIQLGGEYLLSPKRN